MHSALRATTICGLALSTILVGCARRPVLTSMAAAPPAAAASSSRTPAAAPEAIVTLERREEIVVAERPNPATFADDSRVKSIYFDFDRYDIRPGDAELLEADAAWLKSNDMLVIIEGQCDERGTVEYNLALGDRRARAARNHLVAQGIAAERITTMSYGKERPVCSEHTEACWALNRRAHLLVRPRG